MGVEAPQRVAGRGGRTALASRADGVIEAGWLIALAVVPVFLLRDSARTFDAGKAALVRALAAVMLAAWIVRAIERRRVRADAGGPACPTAAGELRAAAARRPLAAAVVLMVVAASVATAVSPAFGTSLEGGFERDQGLGTIVAYGVVFLVAAAALRTRLQVDRVVTVALSAGLPVATYALVQRLGLDPLAWQQPPWAGRPASTLGAPGLLAGYLLLLAPLALARLAGHLERAMAVRGRPGGRWPPAAAAGASLAVVVAAWLVAATSAEQGGSTPPTPRGLLEANVRLHLAVAAVAAAVAPWLLAARRRADPALAAVGVSIAAAGTIVAALLATQSRGAFAGLLAALATLVLAAAALRGARVLAVVVVAVGVCASIGAAVAGAGDARPGRADPTGLARLVDLGGGSTRVRLVLWEAGVDAARPHEPLSLAPGGRDALNPLRPAIGYGPDLTSAVLARFQRPQLSALEAPGARADRVHNQTLEALVQTGALGAAAYLVAVAALLLVALRAMELERSRRDRALLGALLAGGAVSTCAAAVAAGGLRYVGVALPGGMVLGFLALLAVRSWRPGPGGRSAATGGAAGDAAAGRGTDAGTWTAAAGAAAGRGRGAGTWTAAGIAAALVGHVLDSQLGIVSTASVATSWVLAAALVALAGGAAREEGPEARDGAREPLAAFGALAGLIAGGLVFGLVNRADLDSPAGGMGRLLVGTLAGKQTSEGLRPSAGTAWVLAVAVLGMAVLLAAERSSAHRAADRARGGASVAAMAAAMAAAFAIPHAFLQSRGAVADVERPVWALALLCGLLLLGGGAVAAGLRPAAHARGAAPRHAAVLMTALVAVLAAVVVAVGSLRPAYAGILLGRASAPGVDAGDAVRWARRAHDLQPAAGYPLAFVAHASMALAATLGDARARDAAIASAERAARRAERLNPLDVDATVLRATVHRRAAGLVASGRRRRLHLARAGALYRRAIRAAPALADVQAGYAALLLDLADALRDGDPAGSARARAAARVWSRRAVALDPDQPVGRAVLERAARAPAGRR